jgi:c-di-GMP-binding flagellar brake protein YcgR
MDGVTWDVSPNGLFIRCAKPLRLHELCGLTIEVPGEERSLVARAEVVWSNIHGQDDEITPRGMGVRFLQISGEDRQTIARGMFEELKSEKMDPSELRDLKTIMLGQDELSSAAA